MDSKLDFQEYIMIVHHNQQWKLNLIGKGLKIQEFEHSHCSALTVPNDESSTWIYFQKLQFPHTLGYHDKDSLKHTNTNLTTGMDFELQMPSMLCFLCIKNIKAISGDISMLINKGHRVICKETDRWFIISIIIILNKVTTIA